MNLMPATGNESFPRQLRSAVAHQVSITPDYPIALHYVKALFLARQYRQCIQRCQNLLGLESLRAFSDGYPVKQHPSPTHVGVVDVVHVVFLNYYAALSHESLARLMHNFSASKLPAYAAAEALYEKALEVSSFQSHHVLPMQLDKHSKQFDSAFNKHNLTQSLLQADTALENVDEMHKVVSNPPVESFADNRRVPLTHSKEHALVVLELSKVL